MNTVIERSEAMKFIINSRTFDTANSTRVAISRDQDQGSFVGYTENIELRWEDVLYRTAKGAFFVHSHNTSKPLAGGRPVTKDSAEEFQTPEDAVRWIERMGAVILDPTGLPLPPEA